MVWWYSSIQVNRAGAAPWIHVVLRQLDGDRLTDNFKVRKIGLPRLGLYQPGVIVIDGFIRAKAETEVRWFDVDFSSNGWTYESVSKLGLSSPGSDYFIPPDYSYELALQFSLGNGSLIMNCVEYLIRGYSRRSELTRVLTTYEPHEAMARLFDQEADAQRDTSTEAPGEWTIYPHRDMVNDDAELLALLYYKDARTLKTVHNLFSQFGPVNRP